jgi:hypothetical protein
MPSRTCAALAVSETDRFAEMSTAASRHCRPQAAAACSPTLDGAATSA